MKHIQLFEQFVYEELEWGGANYDKKFDTKILKFLKKLGYTNIEFENDGIEFINPKYNGLINKDAPKILDFIDDYGYDSDDFGVYGSRITYPENF